VRRVESLKIPGVRSDKLGERDNGKVFILTEMPSEQGERWANRVIFAVMNAGVDVPEGVQSMGMAGVAAIGIKALGKVPFEIAEPLLDEMFGCVQYQHDPHNPLLLQSIMSGNDSQIEEVMTRWKIRGALFTLHTGFSQGAVAPTTASKPSAANAA